VGLYTNYTARNILALLIATIYFLIATSHIFLIKNTTRTDKSGHIHNNVVIKKNAGGLYSKVDNANLIRLIDKTTVENKKTIGDFIKLIAECSITILFFIAIWLLKPRFFNIKPRLFINYQDHYLSICALRI